MASPTALLSGEFSKSLKSTLSVHHMMGNSPDGIFIHPSVHVEPASLLFEGINIKIMANYLPPL